MERSGSPVGLFSSLQFPPHLGITLLRAFSDDITRACSLSVNRFRLLLGCHLVISFAESTMSSLKRSCLKKVKKSAKIIKFRRLGPTTQRLEAD